MAAKIAEHKQRKAYAGQAVRLLDVPADAGRGFGLLDNAGPETDPTRLAEALQMAAFSAFGRAGPAFARALFDTAQEEARAVVVDLVDSSLDRVGGRPRSASRHEDLAGAAGYGGGDERGRRFYCARGADRSLPTPSWSGPISRSTVMPCSLSVARAWGLGRPGRGQNIERYALSPFERRHAGSELCAGCRWRG